MKMTLKRPFKLSTSNGAKMSITPQMAQIMWLLMCHRFVSNTMAIETLYPNPDDEPELAYNVIGVLVCKLRDKICRFGFSIDTNYRQGYTLVYPGESSESG